MELKYIIAIILILVVIYLYQTKMKTAPQKRAAASKKSRAREIMEKIDDRMLNDLSFDEFKKITGGNKTQYMDLYEKYEENGSATLEDYKKIFSENN